MKVLRDNGSATLERDLFGLKIGDLIGLEYDNEEADKTERSIGKIIELHPKLKVALIREGGENDEERQI